MGMKLPPERMQGVAWGFLCAYGFLLPGRAWSMSCTASPDSLVSEQTLYSISDDSSVPDVNGSDCEYSWAQGKRVLANHDESAPELVVSHSINHLITSGCIDNTTFSGNCLSKGIGHEALCKPNCTLNALLRSQKRKEFGAVVAAVVVVVVLLVVLLGVYLWCKFKHKTSSWRPPRCNYTAGTAEEGHPRAEVEAGNA